MRVKSVNPFHIRPVARGVGIKKGELRSVHLLQLVETAGIEPASARPLLSALHAYFIYYFNEMLPDEQGKQFAILIKFSSFGAKHATGFAYESRRPIPNA